MNEENQKDFKNENHKHQATASGGAI